MIYQSSIYLVELYHIRDSLYYCILRAADKSDGLPGFHGAHCTIPIVESTTPLYKFDMAVSYMFWNNSPGLLLQGYQRVMEIIKHKGMHEEDEEGGGAGSGPAVQGAKHRRGAHI